LLHPFSEQHVHSYLRFALAAAVGLLLLTSRQVSAATDKPAWCRTLPRAEFKALERVPVKDTWFEVYKVVPGVLAIYEPHQSEETIGYLILGSQRALLFDTGMGIGNLRTLVTRLTPLPVTVLNSHTHNDHVGDNWQFDSVYNLDTEFSRKNALGSRDDAQAEIAAGEICGKLPAGFKRQDYATRPWKSAGTLHDGEHIDLGGRTIEVIATPGHTPDSIALFDSANGLLFTGDTYYVGTIWLFRPETDLTAYGKSIQHLAELAPHVKLVLGAHNIPVARPDVLTRLAEAFDQVRKGSATPLPAGPGQVIYRVGEFSFLMREK
jgi:glyoxylase-like metal-dependent hydrolase (beta-lactamase superfamily II)